MPFAQLADVRLRYELDGDPKLPVLMLCNSLGTTVDMWAPQMPAFLAHFRSRRANTALPSSAAMRWRCSTTSASSGFPSAACRWAA